MTRHAAVQSPLLAPLAKHPQSEGNLGYAFALSAVAIAGLISLALIWVPFGHAVTTFAAMVMTALALAGWWQARKARTLALEQAAKLKTVFEQAGISLWLEDWTPVALTLQSLMAAGVTDMRAYFTNHPAEARALRRSVIIKDVNAFTVEMMGATDKSVFLGSLDRILPDTDQTFIEWLVAFERGDRLYRSETHITRPDGSEIDCLFTAALPRDPRDYANILVSAWDITQQKRQQEKLVLAETEMARKSRITTMGALTASIAHELNSPLAAIVSNAEAARRWLKRPVPDHLEAEAAINHVVRDSVRARDVVARTRSFLSNAPNRACPVDIAGLARDSVSIIDRELRTHAVSLHFYADEALPLVNVDSVQIQQVIVNLLLNGSQAMAQLAGPRDLTLTVRQESSQLRVSIQDVGKGIEPETLARLFEPFFTTKPNGMGMGLTICKNCIEAHGGKLTVTSRPDFGSLFEFTLPIVAHS